MSALDPGVAQRAAADSTASVWVAASAGTGKTKVLTDRVLALMLGGSDPSRILCLTFTRAAAAEMAIRLNDRLARWAVLGDGALAQDLLMLLGRMPDAELLAQARRLFARVLDAPGGMKIETIHAFCQSLLRRFPLEAGIAPHFDLMDERDQQDALAAARDEMLAQARAGTDDVLAAALAVATARAAEQTFDTVMAELVAARARLAAALADGDARFCARLEEALDIPADATPDAIVAAACASGACDDDALRQAAAALLCSDKISDLRAGERISDWLAAGAGRPGLFDAYCGAFFTQEGEERKRIMTSALVAMSPAAEAALRCEAARLREAMRLRAAAALMQATRALATLGGTMLARYARHKRERALLDYDDLVLHARDLLRREGVAPWVLFKLDGGLDHILIDEAQDTNPDQWAVVERLADEFFVGLSARPENRTVFAVGDTKQSIFSFQRADPSEFLRMRAHFKARAEAAESGWRTVELGTSFRSTEAVLAAVDAVFSRPEASAGVALDGAAIRHTAFRAGAGGLVELWPPVAPLAVEPLAAWDPPIEQQRLRAPPARLAQAIAFTIQDWLARGERLPARDRRVMAGDVLVLVRRRTGFVTELVRALKERGVPVAGSDRMRLTEQLAVQDMMALLQFLLLPEDDLTLATVLKGPLIGFDEDELFRLAYGRGRETRLWAELRRRAGECESFGRAAALLSALLARADFAPPYELLAEVLGADGGRRQMSARLGPEAADALDELLAAALAYERRHGASLQGFLHWLAAGDIETKRDLDQRGRDEVRIMTVHGAKGLQAPIVILPDTLQIPNRGPAVVWTEFGLPLWRSHPGCAAPALDLARAAAAQRRSEEYRRLLYVAMTRAEDRLYVCGWQTKRSPPAGAWHELVAAGLQAAVGVESFAFAAPAALGGDGWTGTGLRLVTPQQGQPRGDNRVADFTGTAALPDWATRPPPPEPIPPRPLAPSQPSGTEPAPRSPLGADDGAGFRRGLLVHRLLQSLPQLAPAARAAAARRYLARPVHGLEPAAQEALVAEILAILADPDLAALFGPDSIAEVPVVGLVGGRAVAGRIDRLVVQPDAVLIVDYKTLRPVPASAADIPSLYLEQLRAYGAAVAAVYPGRAVRCALLWTDGPTLMPVDPARLAIDAPRAHS